MIEYSIRNDFKRLQRLLKKKRTYVSDEDRNSLNNIIKYVNRLDKINLESNEVAHKLIIHDMMNKVVLNKVSGLEAFAQIEKKLSQPLDAIYESIQEETPFIEIDKVLDEYSYHRMFEVKEVKYVVPTEKKEKHNKGIIKKIKDKLTSCFENEKDIRQSIEKRTKELICKYSK